MKAVRNIILKNRFEELERLNQILSEIRTEMELEKDIYFNLNLALEEAITNIIKYQKRRSVMMNMMKNVSRRQLRVAHQKQSQLSNFYNYLN